MREKQNSELDGEVAGANDLEWIKAGVSVSWIAAEWEALSFFYEMVIQNSTIIQIKRKSYVKILCAFCLNRKE